jgi:PiT family inorganic phosphate transporter
LGLLVVAVALALAFDVTNGFHDSANAVAALVATRAARPAQAITVAAVFNVLGPVLVGTAVANTIGGVVNLPADRVLAVTAAALTGALGWNLVTWWRGLPSSSSHALVGGLVGAALVGGGGRAIRWGAVAHLRPVGVIGVLISLAVSPLLGFGGGVLGMAAGRRGARRLRRGAQTSVRRAEWVTAAALAFSHGANDAQKTMGVITLMLVAHGDLRAFAVPLWVKLAAAAALTLGTSMGGWRIIRTVGSGIYRMGSLDGLISQGTSATIILASAAAGGPVSTTHVVAASVVGVGAAQHRRHVRWAVVTEMGLAWLVTLPCAAALAALFLTAWRQIA